MKLLDANVLLLAYNDSDPHHARARAWLEATLWGNDPVALSWTTVLSFIRIASSPRVLSRPMTPTEATNHVDSWLTDGGVQIAAPLEHHWDIVRRLIETSGARGNLVMDADLAALALEYGATLCTADADFARFKGIKVENPLATR